MSRIKKFYTPILLLLFWSFPQLAQEATVMGRVIDANATEPIPNVEIRLLTTDFTTQTDALGTFSIISSDLPLGEQVLTIHKSGYVTKKMHIVIQHGSTVNLDPILFYLDLTEIESQIGVISLSDAELNQDEGTAYTISGLLQASRDVFLNAAAFDFSATFFKPRGLDNANGKVLINGLEMNKQFDGRPQWANWGGLNDAQRNREFSTGISANEYTFGDLAGTTNIIMRASKYRKGGRVSFASANRSYRGRVMASYNSGLLASGWAYAVLASRRYGEQGYQDGTVYDANSFFASVEKKLNTTHSLNLSAFYTPNRRGRSTALTEEMKALKGTRYNPNWGFQNGKVRNSRTREVEEPILILNHFWDVSDNTNLNTNVGYQIGKIANTRIDNGGTRLSIVNGQEAFLGGARNPFGNYYQRLPSFFLQAENPTAFNFQQAYLAQQEFLNDGQLDWDALYEANTNSTNSANGGNSIYVLQEDRVDDTQLSLNSILNSRISDHIILSGNLSYRLLKSENFASLKDLLGGTGYLDVDFFAEDDVNTIVGDIAQSDLRNRNRIVKEGERYKYNYTLDASVISGFAQGAFTYKKIDFYVAVTAGQTQYQRIGLFENGNYPGARSFGPSETVSFTNYGIKGGATYKFTGRHLATVNAGYFTKAPSLRNTFNNARQNNDVVIGLQPESIQNLDVSYIFRSPTVKARLTGFYINSEELTDIGFYFTENLTGIGLDKSAFVQEITTGIATRNVGGELGIEAQVTPAFKLKAAASVGQYIYNNNPNLYLTSDDFEGPLTFGDGTTKLKNYHVAGGPERAYQLGIEYRDPEFWWTGITTNYFSNAYVDINNLSRTSNFSQDFDGLPFSDYNQDVGRDLLTQQEFEAYFLVNIVGGKSWRIKSYYVGFFATVNNVLNQEYITGGFEQGRLSNYRDINEDVSRKNGRLFGPRYFYGNGTTYYANVYVRF
jgi:Carboxypeptidase regulatory-like domain